MARLRQYCSFSIDDLSLAIDVRMIQEVLPYLEMTRVPSAPPMIRGLVNLRGQIVTAVDLRHRLELPSAPMDWLPMNVVIRSGDLGVSFLVDTIGDVLELDEAECVSPPDTIPQVIRDVLVGIHPLRESLLLIVDPNKVVNTNGSVSPSRNPEHCNRLPRHDSG